jgi:hypothetical protein
MGNIAAGKYTQGGMGPETAIFPECTAAKLAAPEGSMTSFSCVTSCTSASRIAESGPSTTSSTYTFSQP